MDDSIHEPKMSNILGGDLLIVDELTDIDAQTLDSRFVQDIFSLHQQFNRFSVHSLIDIELNQNQLNIFIVFNILQEHDALLHLLALNTFRHFQYIAHNGVLLRELVHKGKELGFLEKIEKKARKTTFPMNKSNSALLIEMIFRWLEVIRLTISSVRNFILHNEKNERIEYFL